MGANRLKEFDGAIVPRFIGGNSGANLTLQFLADRKDKIEGAIAIEGVEMVDAGDVMDGGDGGRTGRIERKVWISKRGEIVACIRESLTLDCL